MNNSVGKGAFVLIVSGLICKLFGGLFRLPLTNIIGLEGIAIYQMVITIYSFSLVFVSGGVTSALSKLVSSARARGDTQKIGSYLKYALIFSIGLSLFFGVVFLLFAQPISSLQGASGTASTYRLLALLLPLGALVGIARGVLQGYGNMTPTAISQIIEQVLKFAFGLIFAYLFQSGGVQGGVFGAVLGITLGEVFACFYLATKIFRLGKFSFAGLGKQEFFKATLPLTFGGIILPLTHTIEALFAVKLISLSGLSIEVAKAVYGVQTGIVGAILNFPLIISLALASSLLPNLSYMAEKGDVEGQREVVGKALSSMWFLLIPLVVGVMAISKTLFPILYPQSINGYLEVAEQLTFVGGLSTIITAIMQQLVSILQANGHFGKVFLFYAIGGVAKIVLLVLVSIIPTVSVFSIALSNIVLASIVSLCAIIKLRPIIQVPLFNLLLPLLASAVMFMLVKISLSILGGIWGLLLAVFVGGAVYLALCFPLVSKYLALVLARLRKKSE